MNADRIAAAVLVRMFAVCGIFFVVTATVWPSTLCGVVLLLSAGFLWLDSRLAMLRVRRAA